MRRALGVTAALLAVTSGGTGSAQAQPVPAATATDYRSGLVCGLAGENALAIADAIRAEAGLRPLPATDRFELFSSADRRVQWAVTKPGEPAHAAVTCREVSADQGGMMQMTRGMRCDAAAAACDALLSEFTALDDAVKAQIAERRNARR